MSIVRYPESMKSTDLQIWDNAAFDNGGESEDSSAMFKSSWTNLNPVILSSSESFDSFSSKENQTPLCENNRLTVKSQSQSQSHVPSNSKPILQNGRLKSVAAKVVQGSKSGFLEKKSIPKSGNEENDDDRNSIIDLEIEEIEKEIIRLSSRLEALKIEKAEKLVKTVEKRGKVVPAKFLEQKQSGKNGDEIMPMSAKSKVQRRRGVSMGPWEIVGAAGARSSGMSLGPAEIFAGSNAKIIRQIGKQESAITTPIQTIQNRRKSCFWNLQDIEEEKMIPKERRKSSSVSPKSRKLQAKILASRQAATTVVASRKTAKRQESIVNSIQPKKLFKDGDKSSSSAAATNKKPLRPGRIVASRYNNSNNNNNQGRNQASSAMRKRSLPENNNDQDEDESKRCDKKRSLSVGKSRPGPAQSEIKKNSATTTEGQGRVKKRWEIPTEVVVVVNRNSPPVTTTISDVTEPLPSIRTTRCLIETPRDSGPAKRVAELVGRKSYFSINEEELEDTKSSSVCQALNFGDDDDGDEELT